MHFENLTVFATFYFKKIPTFLEQNILVLERKVVDHFLPIATKCCWEAEKCFSFGLVVRDTS